MRRAIKLASFSLVCRTDTAASQLQPEYGDVDFLLLNVRAAGALDCMVPGYGISKTVWVYRWINDIMVGYKLVT